MGKLTIFKAAERNQLCSLDIDCLRAQARLLPNFFPPGAVPYLIFVIFFTRAKFLENKIHTEKTRKIRKKYTEHCQFFALLRQNTQ